MKALQLMETGFRSAVRLRGLIRLLLGPLSVNSPLPSSQELVPRALPLLLVKHLLRLLVRALLKVRTLLWLLPRGLVGLLPRGLPLQWRSMGRCGRRCPASSAVTSTWVGFT